MSNIDDSRREFWDKRAALGFAAGTNDLNAKALEIDNIAYRLGDARQVLDAGCGNGSTAIAILARNPGLLLSGFDYSEVMIREAGEAALASGVSGRLTLAVGNLLSPPFGEVLFDAAYTERALINLNNAMEQKLAVSMLLGRVKPGGKAILCESFADGLAEINLFRDSVGLARIEQPWHNRYLAVSELPALLPDGAEIEAIDNFSSTYYFLSRVVNACLARDAGEEPSYDAPVNKLAFSLPGINLCAQVKIVVIRKIRQPADRG
jgi:SAM-dependent methyltransferase